MIFMQLHANKQIEGQFVINLLDRKFEASRKYSLLKAKKRIACI